jgi:hypothetical protein
MIIPENHLHFHLCLPGLGEITDRLQRMEQKMGKELDALGALAAKVDDLIADVRALLASEAGNLSPEGQEKADALMAKVDAFDAEIGDADGSDALPEA